jgi:hypothetical protein
VAANATREEVKEAVAAAPSSKTATTPGWDEWEYWWQWWKATWYTPLSLFFLGFALYQTKKKVHIVVFFGLGIFFLPIHGWCYSASSRATLFIDVLPLHQEVDSTNTLWPLLLPARCC